MRIKHSSSSLTATVKTQVWFLHKGHVHADTFVEINTSVAKTYSAYFMCYTPWHYNSSMIKSAVYRYDPQLNNLAGNIKELVFKMLHALTAGSVWERYRLVTNSSSYLCKCIKWQPHHSSLDRSWWKDFFKKRENNLQKMKGTECARVCVSSVLWWFCVAQCENISVVCGRINKRESDSCCQEASCLVEDLFRAFSTCLQSLPTIFFLHNYTIILMKMAKRCSSVSSPHAKHLLFLNSATLYVRQHPTTSLCLCHNYYSH